ncbi:MAG: VTT domain-containing protein [Planctomycetota bacterium]|nr:VTT domain-containing protein [Planctomycetota bacterium]
MISFLRGFTLIPSTPFVIAGVLLFPENKIIVLLISLGGILFSATLLYYLSEFLGFDSYFEKIAPERVIQITTKIDSPWGFLFVVLWAFFPLAPTDLVCYIAGTARMNFLRFILAVALGELIICLFYTYSLGSLNLLQ